MNITGRGEPGGPELIFLSMGWGEQSFTLGAMVALGDLPPIDLAIHADTGHEAQGTYEHAERYTGWLGERGLRVVTVQDARTEIVMQEWSGSVQIPAFTKQDQTGAAGQLLRQCTRNWKLNPIRRHVRTLLPGGRPKPESVHCWQGIRWDELERMRDSDVRYIRNVYPLVELRMTRLDCRQHLLDHGLAAPVKSSCVFCPYHSMGQWTNMKMENGEDWRKAQAVDALLRDKRPGYSLFVHPGRAPLAQAVTIPGENNSQPELDLAAPCDGGTCFS